MFDHYKELIEHRLSEFIIEHSSNDSFKPIKYIIEIGGKRRIIVEKYDTVFEGKKKYYIQMNEPL